MPSAVMPVRTNSVQKARQELRDQVRKAIRRSQTTYAGLERRRNLRVPFPYPIYLTPVDPNGDAVHEKRFAVVGRHLSECGLDFYHSEPVTSRKLIASLDDHNDQVGFVMELTWCRFGRHGWYENGGRFVSIAQTPLATVRKLELDGCPFTEPTNFSNTLPPS